MFPYATRFIFSWFPIFLSQAPHFPEEAFKSSDILFYSVISLSISFPVSEQIQGGTELTTLSSAIVYKRVYHHPQLGGKIILHHEINQKQ